MARARRKNKLPCQKGGVEKKHLEISRKSGGFEKRVGMEKLGPSNLPNNGTGVVKNRRLGWHDAKKYGKDYE